MKAKLWVPGLVLILALLAACASATTTPKPTPTPSPSPTPKPTTAASPSPTAKPAISPTAKPTAAPVSFAGKAITIVVPFAPGGGGDLAGRLYGKFLSNLLPGKPSVVVRNMPGGAATIGANFVYAAKPDGLTAMVAGGSVPLNQLVGLDAVKYDVY
ncbi:MAG: hypothetical protein HYX90_05630, partial [Chloroflexi bacterium]|nr:hypothetical protein [Chloroflexota bacterium]